MNRHFVSRILLAASEAGGASPDGELLGRYARDKDPMAFELLVHRHANSVWAACRGVLRCEADAEDAFQVAFLALALRAGSIRGASAGGWLHQVALNAALKIREKSRRSPTLPADRFDSIPAPRPDTEPEESGMIHRELARLPERYRLPLILCEIEGHSLANAARLLDCPVGSVASRLSRARAMLRTRLGRHGTTSAPMILTAGGLSASLVAKTASASLGDGVLSPDVIQLTQGMLNAMKIAKIKLLTAVVAGVGMASLAGLGGYSAMGQPTPDTAKGKTTTVVEQAVPKSKPQVVAAGDSITAFAELDPESLEDLILKCPRMFGARRDPDETAVRPGESPLRQLQRERLKAALGEIELIVSMLKAGQLNHALELPEASKNVITAIEDLRSGSELRPWLEERVRVAKWHERVLAEMIKAGRTSRRDLNAARFARLDAEIALVKLTEKK